MFFRNADTRKFLLDAFEDDVREIIETIIDNEDVNTDMVDRQQLFRMSVDIAKKRESYVSRRKKKLRPKDDLVDLTLSVNKVAAKVAAAATDAKKVDKDAKKVDKDAKKVDKDAKKVDKDAKVDEDVLDELVDEDKNAQQMRSEMKTKFGKTKKSSKKKAPKKKAPKKKAKQTATNDRGEVLKPGMKVQGKWKGEENFGEWFDGVVVSVNNRKKTIHIQYDDGDDDKALSFNDVSII